MIKANELISNILNNKTYDYETAADDINSICEGFNNYLLKKKLINLFLWMLDIFSINL